MDVARSAPQGAQYHAGAIYLLTGLGVKEGAKKVWNTELGLHQFSNRPQRTAHLCILNQARDARGATLLLMNVESGEITRYWGNSQVSLYG